MELQKIQETIATIKQLQLLVSEIFNGSQIQNKQDEYAQLYKKIKLEINLLQEEGLSISNPNKFSSLWELYNHCKYETENRSSRQICIYELYETVLNQLEIILGEQYAENSLDKFTQELKPSRIEALILKVEELKEILAIATKKSEIQYEEEGYQELYQEIALQIVVLQSTGIPILNPNYFRSLWQWYDHWSSNRIKYASSDICIDELYANLVEPIRKALNKHRLRGTSAEEFVQDLKCYFNQQESAQISASQAPIELRLRGNVTTMSSEMAQPKPIQNRWALLVGVNHYIDIHSFPRLNFCVNDVLALEQTLKELDYIVVCLHDQRDRDSARFPTRDNVEAELTRLCETVEPDDLLLVHFACHGKLIDGEPVLITNETRATNMAKKALRLAGVKQQMQQSKARRQVVTLDACHTGVEVGRDVTDPEFIRNSYELAEGFAMICASTAQQIAQEWKEKEHGVFTYYLLEGLSGKADRSKKGFVTVDDLKTHVLHNLRRWNVEQGGAIQEPTAQTEGMGDMILADYRDHSQGDLL